MARKTSVPDINGAATGPQTSQRFFTADYLADYPDAAIICDHNGDILKQNRPATALAEIIRGTSGLKLLAMIRLAAMEGRPLRDRLRFRAATKWRNARAAATGEAPNPGDGDVVFDLSLLPLADGTVLLLGRDITADRHLLDSLLASRAMFRDLVACSSDWAWETDASGHFRYVSGERPFGYTPGELVGASVEVLAFEDKPNHDIEIFHLRRPVRAREILVRNQNGKPQWVRVSATPYYDRNNLYLGMRGVCRDITDVHYQQEIFEIHQRREMAGNAILGAISRHVEACDILDAVTSAAAAALHADNAWLFRYQDDTYLPVCAFPTANAVPVLAPDWQKELDPDGVPSLVPIPDRRHGLYPMLAATIRYSQSIVGAILFSRTAMTAAWGDEEFQLLHHMQQPLGIALIQVAHREELNRLARTDSLTGLLNRRAFVDMVRHRQLHLRRMGREAAMLFLDLDNFKLVNDKLGHAEGDRVLKELSALIRSDHRAGDISARLGGDEFVLWLEETGELGAVKKAERLLRDFEAIARHYDTGAETLGISVGIVVVDPGTEAGADELLAKADSAMYAAKRAGKNGLFFAGGRSQAGDAAENRVGGL